MPDTPDYNKYQLNSVRFSLQDMGELAARMNSIVTYDRRGEVLFMDDFSQGIGTYQKLGSGGVGDFILSTANPLWHGFHGRLVTDTANNANEEFFKQFSSSEIGRIGFETSISMTADTSEVDLKIFQYDGLVQKQFKLIIDNKNNLMQVLNEAGNAVTVIALPWFNSVAGTYRYIKLVCDFDTMKYVRVQIDKFEYDLKDYTGFTSAISEQYGYRVGLIVFTRSAASITADVGHVIITGSEP